MKSLQDLGGEYLGGMSKQKKISKVYSEHQHIGLEIAGILSDPAHKALYIRLAKKFGKEKLMPLAKSVAERKDIKNLGAYFMSVLYKKDDKEK